MSEHDVLERLVDQLLAREVVTTHDWPAGATVKPVDLGLRVQPSGELNWPEEPQLLDSAALAATIPQMVLRYFSYIDSTNTRLVSAGAERSVSNHLYITEFQYGGRGRRGRSWLSPFARNLAMSLGVSTVRSMSELGGLSIVVGLALADVFESLSIKGVQLKWPNDILVNQHKLSGILVELVQRGGEVEYVVGIGVNIHITADERRRIGQPVTDLRSHGVWLSRTELVVRLIRTIRAYLDLFEEQGFAAFANAFNDLHLYHGRNCSIVQGKNTIDGVVKGIGEQGELILQTDQGEERFHGGEVSLHPSRD